MEETLTVTEVTQEGTQFDYIHEGMTLDVIRSYESSSLGEVFVARYDGGMTKFTRDGDTLTFGGLTSYFKTVVTVE